MNTLKFFSNVNKTDGCWLWTSRLDKSGYGQFKVGNKNFTAHKISFELSKGKVPDGLELDHLCRVRHCINPDHLEPVTKRENCLRGISFAAINAAKTMCANGHELTKENTYIRPNGHRDCRACIRSRSRQYKKRKSA